MAIAMKIASQISKSSWIRRMFEEGERLRQELGPDKIYDFTLGNPDVEPPEAFGRELRELLDLEVELRAEPIRLDELGAATQLPPATLLGLGNLLEEDGAEVA